jgi:hypothetical protein
VALAASVVMGGGACSVSPALDGRSERTARLAQAIHGGESDLVHGFAVGIYDRSRGFCSGSLIAPNLVLTARHCVAATTSTRIDCANQFAEPSPPTDVFVTVDATLSAQSRYFELSRIVVPPATAFCGNDIALLVLASNVPSGEASPVEPLVQGAMTDRRLASGRVVAIGYGLSQPGGDDSGARRIKQQIPIDCIPGDGLLDCSKLGRPSDSELEFVTAGSVCKGDSGSSAYDQTSFDRGMPIAIGVASRVLHVDTDCSIATYTRTDRWAGLIVDAAKSAAQQGGYALPSWARRNGQGADAPNDAGLPKVLGARCAKHEDCATMSCASLAGSSSFVCTQPCAGPTCPLGFACLSGYCFEGSSGAVSEPTVSHGQARSCAAAPVSTHDGRKGAGAGAAALLAFLLVACARARGRTPPRA